MNKILFSSKNVYTLLSIRTVTFLNVFVSFRYRIGSISKALLSNIIAAEICFCSQDRKGIHGTGQRYSGQEGCHVQEGSRTEGMQDRRDSGQEGYRTGGMQDWRDAGQVR